MARLIREADLTAEIEAGGAVPEAAQDGQLKRALGLPLLVFYGLGVTVGAGIFALVGEIYAEAGALSPIAFLVAALLAGTTAASYAVLSRRFPRAAGAALYAQEGFGTTVARITGVGVAITGIVSSAVIALAFSSYLATLIPVPNWVLALGLVAMVTAIAVLGVRESVLVAAGVTLLEVGTLVVVLVTGAPELGDAAVWREVVALPSDWAGFGILLGAATIAFYAFIGFEDIVNMAEETKRPERVLPPAILITLVLTTIIYVLVAVLGVAVGERIDLGGSDAPIADIFAETTGLSPAPVAAIAAVAMINGVLIQFVMVSRLLYGMSRDRMIRAPWLATLLPVRRTPAVATGLVAVIVATLILVLPLVDLAEITSYVTLAVFTIVNLSLFRIASRPGPAHHRLAAASGLVAALLSAALLVAGLVQRFAA
ncbi:MAG: amino acid permease [Bauldia sp.]|nr:amino acid permease [Bauldia sp.]